MPELVFAFIVYVLPSSVGLVIALGITRYRRAVRHRKKLTIVLIAAWTFMTMGTVLLGIVAGLLYRYAVQNFPADPALPMRPGLIVLGFVVAQVAAGAALLLWLRRYSSGSVADAATGGWKPMPVLECDVVFLSSEEGGRSQPVRALASRVYRPHLVVGPREQRHAIMSAGKFAEDYYGVMFDSGPEYAEPGVTYRVRILLPFYPEIRYEPFVIGASFTIREGWVKIVGHGLVVSRLDRDAA